MTGWLALGVLLVSGTWSSAQDSADREADPALQTLPVQVNLAIDRGIQKLLAWQHQDGSFRTGHSGGYPMGVTSLAAYTLLKSGLPREDPAVQRAFDSMKYMEFKKVYSVSLLILALDALHDSSKKEWILGAAEWLEQCFNQSKRRWGYPHPREDLSNTQYAVLGLWAAGRHGYEARRTLWLDVLREMADQQNRDGGYGYREDDRSFSSGSMTTAGITCIAVAMLELEGKKELDSSRKRTQAMLDRAWEYMDHVFSVEGNPEHSHGLLHQRYHYYYLYGLERIAALGDRRTIGGRNWYREGARYLLQQEHKEGGWGSLENTCFALLFLRRATFSGLTDKQALAATPRAVTWRFTTSKPADDWTVPDFDSRGWSEGTGAFGRFNVPGAPVRTAWQTQDLWVRRRFAWRQDPASFRLFVHHDDAAEIYVNGVLAANVPGAKHHYEEVAVSDEARAALKPDGNVLAAHVNNIGGQQSLDVQFHDVGGGTARRQWFEETERYGVARPQPEAPFLRRWLVLGPVQDPRHRFLLDVPKGETTLRPAEGGRDYGGVWRTHSSPGAVLDFHRAARGSEECGYYAATYLVVSEPVDAVLWFGAADGVRVYLDGEVIYSRHAHQTLKVDQFRVPLRLTAGVHRLLFKVEQITGACSLTARLSARDGGVLHGVRPLLNPERPDGAALARAHPGLLSLDELEGLLPADSKSSLDFASPGDVDRVTVGPTHPDYPQWLARSETRTAQRPAPGAKGMLVVRPPAKDVATRVYWKVTVPSVRGTLVVRVSPETNEHSGQSAVQVRLGAVRGADVEWLAEQRVESGDRASSKDWKLVSADVSAWSGQEALLVVECATAEEGLFDVAYLDELRLR